MLVWHKPQWRRHDRSGSAVGPSVIAVALRKNCQNRRPSRWHGGNFEHVQNFRSATAGWANLQWGRRSTAAAPYNDCSSTSITAVPPQYDCGVFLLDFPNPTVRPVVARFGGITK